MLTQPKLYQTQLSFFEKNSSRVQLEHWTIALIGSGVSADLLETRLTPLCQGQQIILQRFLIPPSVLLEREDGWILPFLDQRREAHVCLFALEEESASPLSSITQSGIPLIQHLLSSHLGIPNRSRRGLLTDPLTCALKSDHRLAKTLFAIGALTQEDKPPTLEDIEMQGRKICRALLGALAERAL